MLLVPMYVPVFSFDHGILISQRFLGEANLIIVDPKDAILGQKQSMELMPREGRLNLKVISHSHLILIH